jgi:hypothetical protein
MTRRDRGVVRRTLGLARLPVVASVALVAALVIVPARQELLLRIYLLVLATFALALLVAAVHRANPVAARSPFDLALRGRRQRPERLADLERIERELTLAQQSAADVHFRLRPRLRQIAAQLLATRRSIELDASPEAARRALGDELWELVRADREPPRRRDAPGLDLTAAGRIITALEGI